LDEICRAASSAVLSARKLKFWLSASFEPTWCPSYSEFGNFEIPSKNSGVKKLKNHFENFTKMLDSSNFDKSCHLESSIQIWIILNFRYENLEFLLKKGQIFV
jgi:hypothetical protein